MAGNNDLPFETADDAGIAYFNQFFQDVQSKLSAKNIDIRLHNLTACYGSKGGTISECSSDISGTAYRVIGFPSYSFKNKEPGSDKNPDLQTAQFKTFRGLLDQGSKEGKKVIIVTHIPEIDDPYFLAHDRYDGVKPEPSIDRDKDNPRSAYSTWNIPPPQPAAPGPAGNAGPGAAGPTYPQPERMLGEWCADVEIRTALNDAVQVLGELLRGFNEVIYKNYIQPNQRD